MSSITQQRLIGSILLLCVLSGIAFFLINRASDDIEATPETETQADIPFVSSIDAIAPNDVEVVETEQEMLVDAQTPAVVIEASPEVELQPEPAQQAAEPIITNEIKTIPAAEKITTTMWSLQLASLADKSAADALSKKVRLLGYKATVEKAETSKGDRFRVRVGPEQDKLALEATSKVLENKLNLKPLMLKQLP